jgi:hypothetical protein
MRPSIGPRLQPGGPVPPVPERAVGRVVEGARLERVYGCKSIEGSNPSLSASFWPFCLAPRGGSDRAAHWRRRTLSLAVLRDGAVPCCKGCARQSAQARHFTVTIMPRSPPCLRLRVITTCLEVHDFHGRSTMRRVLTLSVAMAALAQGALSPVAMAQSVRGPQGVPVRLSDQGLCRNAPPLMAMPAEQPRSQQPSRWESRTRAGSPPVRTATPDAMSAPPAATTASASAASASASAATAAAGTPDVPISWRSSPGAGGTSQFRGRTRDCRHRLGHTPGPGARPAGHCAAASAPAAAPVGPADRWRT